MQKHRVEVKDSFSNVVIGSTTDYKKFTYVLSNRETKEKNIINLMKSFKRTNGMSKSKPILVDSRFNIIDGQHRLMACERMGIPVHYVVTHDRIENIPIYNSCQEKWGLADYARYHSTKGNKNYTRIIEVSEKSGTAINGCMESLGLKTGGSFNDAFKEGRFTFTTDIDKAVSRVEKIKKLCYLIKGSRSISTKISRAVRFLEKIKTFKLEDFISKLEKYPNKLHGCGTSEEYIDMFINIFNYRKRGDVISGIDILAAKNSK